MADQDQDRPLETLYNSVSWIPIGDETIVLVDDEYRVPADRVGVDKNGDHWIQSVGKSTRGPMRPDRIEIVTDQ